MNRSIAPLLFLGLALAAIAGPACAEDDGVRAELDGQYQQLAQAIQQKDVTTLEALIGPDYSSTDAAGVTRSDDQAVGFWKQKLGPLHEITCRFQIESVESRGAEAVVVVRSWTSFKTAGSDGHAPRVERTAIDRDTWRKSCDGWRLSRTTSRDAP